MQRKEKLHHAFHIHCTNSTHIMLPKYKHLTYNATKHNNISTRTPPQSENKTISTKCETPLVYLSYYLEFIFVHCVLERFDYVKGKQYKLDQWEYGKYAIAYNKLVSDINIKK